MTFDVGEGVACDLDRLIAGRLLVQASSGQGKTWAIRRLLEQTYGHVQHLVIDPEGEYYTLREKFDYVHAAAKGGDVVAHPRYAAMLATELLKLGASAIIDVYELNPQDRKAFVKNFCTALVNAPRDLWHPCLIVLDEAHVFCPEKDQAESAEAVKALASRGRKRAFALVLATQRLSKLAKDAAAEMGNKLIGGCRLDIDVKRAAEELGFTDQQSRMALRQLKPGQFFATGAAFYLPDPRHPELHAPFIVREVTVGKVKTTHPEPGQTAAPTPPATDKVRAVLKRLEALPAEAEEREKSIETLRRENTALAVELRLLKNVRHAAAPPPPERVEVPVLEDPHVLRLLQACADVDTLAQHLNEISGHVNAALRPLTDISNELADLKRMVHVKVDVAAVSRTGAHSPGAVAGGMAGRTASTSTQVGGRGAPTRAAVSDVSVSRSGHHTPAATDVDLSGSERRVLNALAWWGAAGITAPTRRQLAFAAGYSVNGRFNNVLGHMRGIGLIEYPKVDCVAWTEAGASLAVIPDEVPDRASLVAAVARVLKPSEQRVFLQVSENGAVSRETLALACNYTVNGRFNNILGKLRGLGVITYPRGNHVALSDMFDALAE